MIYYVCKYTPVELFAGFGQEASVMDFPKARYDRSDTVVHGNICGFGKSIIEAVLYGNVKQLVLMNCCDVIRRVYDILRDAGCCDFLYIIDLPHVCDDCQAERFARTLEQFIRDYESFSGISFDPSLINPLASPQREEPKEPYLALCGGRTEGILVSEIQKQMPFPIVNYTCVAGRSIQFSMRNGFSISEYAKALLSQLPCMRMETRLQRRQIFENPNLRGVIYHTVKFCDYYGPDFRETQKVCSLPIMKLETDWTLQSSGQIQTRIEAFRETLGKRMEAKPKMHPEGKLFVGIDSGSTSTDAVLIDNNGKILSSVIIPTGRGAQDSAKNALEKVLLKAEVQESDIAAIVSTGYGRENIGLKNASITEISCHAKGGFFLNPGIRTIIDIGGQDCKVIRLDEKGSVTGFLMNDKCAAGTGRFLEMVARTLNMSLDELSNAGISWKENIIITNTCTVFAESEIVSLVAQNRDVNDIVHALEVSIASRIATQVRSAGGEPPYMLTGGVAQNNGVVKAISESLHADIYICQEAQICGALGAALFAAGI
jgi:predicted CoA-substrate-specific enzyme activase